ncbi:MAG: proton-conducting transporter membrane subunit [Sulfolobales archaeon]
MDSITTLNSLLTPLYILLIGCFLAPIFKRTASLYISSISSFFACVLMVYISLNFMMFNDLSKLTNIQLLIGNYPLVGGLFNLVMDGLSAYFILILGILGLASSIYGISYIKRYSAFEGLRFYSFLYPLFLMSMYLILISDSIILFIISWELMCIVAFFLIAFEKTNEMARRAALKYLLMSYSGSGLLIIALIIVFFASGAADFTSLSNTALETLTRYSIMFLFVIGFGIKAALVPMHNWLPDAHPEAPSNISALLSGCMIKMAVYGLVRFTMYSLSFDYYVLGLSLASLGILSATYGTFMALIEPDSKKLMAYHSVAQIGYIFLGIGGGLALYPNYLSIIAISAGLFHTLNHAVFKGLLFLTAGSLIYTAKTRDLNVLGGLAKKMPLTFTSGLIASLAISGIPPLNGFVSKWLIILSLFISGQPILTIYSALATFVSALTAASFAKYLSRAFLSSPNNPSLNNVKEVPLPMSISEIFLASLCIILGVFYFQPLNMLIVRVVDNALVFDLSMVNALISELSKILQVFALILLMLLFSLFIGIYLLMRGVKQTPIWTFGTKDLLPKRLGLNATFYYTQFEHTYSFCYWMRSLTYKLFITPITKYFTLSVRIYNNIDTYLPQALAMTTIFLVVLILVAVII